VGQGVEGKQKETWPGVKLKKAQPGKMEKGKLLEINCEPMREIGKKKKTVLEKKTHAKTRCERDQTRKRNKRKKKVTVHAREKEKKEESRKGKVCQLSGLRGDNAIQSAKTSRWVKRNTANKRKGGKTPTQQLLGANAQPHGAKERKNKKKKGSNV